MANTGVERSLTLSVRKLINNDLQVGYPIVYQGRNALTFNGHSYASISVYEMNKMTNENYATRLVDFKAYVESIESGLNITDDTINDAVASRTNTTACPIS